MSEYQKQIQRIKDVKARLAANGLQDIQSRENAKMEAERARRQSVIIARHKWETQDARIVDHLRKGPPKRDYRPEQNPPGITIRKIQADVCKRRGLPLSVMKSAQRIALWVTARYEAMWIAAHLTGKSLPEIGRHFGDRDHSTIHHGIRKYTNLLETGVEEYPPNWDWRLSDDGGRIGSKKRAYTLVREMYADFREAYAKAHDGTVVNITSDGRGWFIVRKDGKRLFRAKKDRILELTAEYNGTAV